MTSLRLPSKRFRCFSVEENKLVLVEVIPPSIWVKETDPLGYSDMSKEEEELFDELVAWKVIFDGKVMWIPKEQLGVLLEKYEEAER